MKVTLVSKDNQKFTIDYEIAEKSETIKNAFLESSNNSEIPLLDVDGKTLSYIVNYLNNSEFPVLDDGSEEDTRTLFSIILAANYLDIKELLDIACQKVANMIKGKTPDEIRKKFNIEKDLKEAEEDQVKKENECGE